MKFSVHPLAPAGLFLILFAMPPARAAGVLAAVISHEAAHLFAGRLFGMRAKKLTLMPTGLSISMTPPPSYAAEAAVAAAGPFVNGVICILIATGLFGAGAAARELFGFSAFFGLLNILPVRRLDGGVLAWSILSRRFGIDAAERVIDITSALFIGVLWLAGVYIFFYGSENFALMGFATALFVSAFMRIDKSKNNT